MPVYPLSKLYNSTNGRRSPLFTASLAAGSFFLGAALYRWWSAFHEVHEDEELFVEVPKSPLLSSTPWAPVGDSHRGPKDSFGFESLRGTGVLTQEERKEALRLARELLGLPANDEDSGEMESTSSEDTDVSLNYHIALELERDIRDDLTQELVQGEAAKAVVQGRMLQRKDLERLLSLTIDYFEMSKEREELRRRRASRRLEAPKDGGAGGVCSNGLDGSGYHLAGGTDGKNLYLSRMRPMDANTAYADLFSRSEELERRLRAPTDSHWEERMEMDWDGDDEVDLMAYLEQDDSAGYRNRSEARMGAKLQRDLRMLDDDCVSDGDFQEDEADDTDDEVARADFERMLLDKLSLLAANIGPRGKRMFSTVSSGVRARGTGSRLVGEVEGHVGGDASAGRHAVAEHSDSGSDWITEDDTDTECTED
uniref:Uncharacterized protein TCIL3000_3_2220 n=1 Tax=Trypanosoma congolense (strain IL3000) TaxID=1068625 RepID=G0UK85_TRYCI|nr:unnamed protein product [Trypanosoma congolense IL3000]